MTINLKTVKIERKRFLNSDLQARGYTYPLKLNFILTKFKAALFFSKPKSTQFYHCKHYSKVSRIHVQEQNTKAISRF